MDVQGWLRMTALRSSCPDGVAPKTASDVSWAANNDIWGSTCWVPYNNSSPRYNINPYLSLVALMPGECRNSWARMREVDVPDLPFHFLQGLRGWGSGVQWLKVRVTLNPKP